MHADRLTDAWCPILTEIGALSKNDPQNHTKIRSFVLLFRAWIVIQSKESPKPIWDAT